MDCIKAMALTLLLYFLLSNGVSGQDILEILVVDYDTMLGVNNSHVRVYDTVLETENFTNSVGRCLLIVANGNKTITVTHSGYITITNLSEIIGNANYTFKLQNLSTHGIMSLRLDDLGLNYAICINNLTNCYDADSTATLTEKEDYVLILVSSEFNLTMSTLPSLYTNTVQPLFILTIIVIVVCGVFYVIRKNITK